MDRIPLKAQERNTFGKKVKRLRKDGFLPANVYGKKKDSESVLVDLKDFLSIYHKAGETGLINLKIGEERTRPVMIKDVQYDPKKGDPLHVDFYSVNLSEKVQVPVPVVVIGDEPEKVHLGEAMIIHPLGELQVEALPTDLIEKVEVDQSKLVEIEDTIFVKDLDVDREKITILNPEDEVVIKLVPVVVEVIEEPAPVEGEEVEAPEVEGEVAAPSEQKSEE